MLWLNQPLKTSWGTYMHMNFIRVLLGEKTHLDRQKSNKSSAAENFWNWWTGTLKRTSLLLSGIQTLFVQWPQVKSWWEPTSHATDTSVVMRISSGYWLGKPQVQWHRMTISVALVNPAINPKLHSSPLKRDQDHVTDVCLQQGSFLLYLIIIIIKGC